MNQRVLANGAIQLLYYAVRWPSSSIKETPVHNTKGQNEIIITRRNLRKKNNSSAYYKLQKTSSNPSLSFLRNISKIPPLTGVRRSGWNYAEKLSLTLESDNLYLTKHHRIIETKIAICYKTLFVVAFIQMEKYTVLLQCNILDWDFFTPSVDVCLEKAIFS
jgi:hypothetical protein